MLLGPVKCKPGYKHLDFGDLSMAHILNPLLCYLPLNQTSLLKKPGSPRQTKLLDGYTLWWTQSNKFTLTIERILCTCGTPFAPFTFKDVRPGTQFNAYDDLFNIRKAEDESLQSLINRVEDKIKNIKDLQPDGFDLQSLNEELTSMTLIRALPAQEYSSFTSSLLLKDKLDKAAVHQAFVTEDIHRRRRAVDIPNTSSAFYTTSKAPKTSKSQVTCSWCNKPGHEEAQCNRKDRDRKRAQENIQFHSKHRPHNANKTQEHPFFPSNHHHG